MDRDSTGLFASPGSNMHALDGATGEILWSFASGGSVNSAPAVVNGVVYWGSGYRRRGLGFGNNKLYAFSVPGH
jgi:polyvinyl alcohol dehydrogenase (cytochrome)